MAATTTEINAYLYNIRTALSEYGSNLAQAQRIGRTDILCYNIKFRILKYLVRIMIDYFDSSDYENVNFFTTDEAFDVVQHINNICGTNYMIEL